MHCVIIMFIHEFIKFFGSLTPRERCALRDWLTPYGGSAQCDPVEHFIECVGFNPWTDEAFGNHIHSYLIDDPSDHDNLHLAYGRLENLAKEDFFCREAEIASVEEDISSVLTQLRTSSGDLRNLYRRLHTIKGIQKYPVDELTSLEDAIGAVSRSSLT